MIRPNKHLLDTPNTGTDGNAAATVAAAAADDDNDDNDDDDDDESSSSACCRSMTISGLSSSTPLELLQLLDCLTPRSL
jgi:hypothetical protein